MKKVVLFFALLLFGVNLSAQDPLFFSKVIEAKGLYKSTIYSAVRSWFSATYNDSDNVIETDDEDAGIIIARGAVEYHKDGIAYACYEGQIKYLIEAQVKNGQYLVVITYITHEVKSSSSKSCELGLITEEYAPYLKGPTKKFHNEVVQDIQMKMEEYSTSLFKRIEETTMSLYK